MRRLISLMVVFMVCVSFKAVEPQEITISGLLMDFTTKTEQIHSFYGAGDFVINKTSPDCDEMRMAHSVSVHGGKLIVDEGTEEEIDFKITSCTYSKGKVFADRGTMEVYRLICNELDGNTSSLWTSSITIQKVKDEGRSKTIISIPRYDSDGVMYQNMILKD